MLVSHTKKFIFLKTLKTASTSVELALEPYARDDQIIYGVNHRTDMIISDSGVVGARGGGANKFQFYNHMPARLVRRNLPRGIWREYKKITTVRNPWDKVISFFYMRRNIPDQFTVVESIQEFRKWIATTNYLGEDFQIYSINGRSVVDEFIRYENLVHDFRKVCKILEIPKTNLSNEKARLRRNREIAYQEYYDEAAKQIVESRFEQDIALHGWTFE